MITALKNVLVGLLLLVSGTAAIATPSTARVDGRQYRQEARIERGVARGELTARETAKLQARQQHVENVETRTTSDGIVTPAERLILERKQDRSSQAIRRQTRDLQDRNR